MGEIKSEDSIKFQNIDYSNKAKVKLIKCLTNLSTSELTSEEEQNKLKNLLSRTKNIDEKEQLIIKIVNELKLFPDTKTEVLRQSNISDLKELIKESEKRK